MRDPERLLVVILFMLVGVAASQVISVGQDARNDSQNTRRVSEDGASNVSPRSQSPRAIESQVNNLLGTPRNEVVHKLDSDNAARREELRVALLKGTAKNKIQEAIDILQAVVKRAPGTDEAHRATAAILLLKGQKGATTQAGDVLSDSIETEATPRNLDCFTEPHRPKNLK